MSESTIPSQKDTVYVETPEGDVYKMANVEYSRWLALVDAIHIIERKSEQMKIDISDDSKWNNLIKPLAIQKYVNERSKDLLPEIEADLTLKRTFVHEKIETSDNPNSGAPQLDAYPLLEEN